MSFEEFKNFAILDDENNIFSVTETIPKIVPSYLLEFYKNYNPIDVEVTTDIGAVKFYPAEKLEELQKEYSIENAFVFATCNSDPIFISNGIIYSCAHGCSKADWEIMNNELYSCFLPQKKM